MVRRLLILSRLRVHLEAYRFVVILLRLQDLIQQPSNARNWHGPYFDPPKLPLDPWGNPYVYYYPGKHNPSSYDLLSIGPDQKEGTDDDIGNWMQ